MKTPYPKSCDLRHTITIQDYADDVSSDGQPTRSYFEFCTARAKIDPIQGARYGREIFIGEETFAESDTLITLRYVAGITTKMRVLFESVYYNIIRVRDIDMRHVWIELTCQSGLADEA